MSDEMIEVTIAGTVIAVPKAVLDEIEQHHRRETPGWRSGILAWKDDRYQEWLAERGPDSPMGRNLDPNAPQPDHGGAPPVDDHPG